MTSVIHDDKNLENEKKTILNITSVYCINEPEAACLYICVILL